MGELVYLYQRSLADYHTQPECNGMFHLERRDDIKYPIALMPIVLNQAPFVLCEKCQTAYFPKGFDAWLDKKIIQYFFAKGCSLPGSIYKMARHQTNRSDDEIADELEMSRIRYKKFEHGIANLEEHEEIRLKLCLHRRLSLNAFEFKGVTHLDQTLQTTPHILDMKEFKVESWF